MKKNLLRIKKMGAITALLLLATCPCIIQAQQAGPDSRTPANRQQKQQATEWMKQSNTGNGFIENKGQITDQDGKANPAVKYLLNMPGLNVQLRKTGFSYDAWVREKTTGKGDQKEEYATAAPNSSTEPAAVPVKFHRVDIELEGANQSAVLLADAPLPGTDNVINELGGFSGIHQYARVIYQNIYPGIDLEFEARRGKKKPVEYNFIVHAGADASAIKMKYNSDADITLNNGELTMQLAFGKLTEKIPASYLQDDHQNLAVLYKPLDEAHDVYAFNVPDYNHNKTLVIDPTPNIKWATLYGGTVTDQITEVDLDAAGNIYAAGTTTSTSGIATGGTVYQSNAGGGNDAFVAKFSGAGARQWATYISGTGNETGQALRVSGTYVYAVGAVGSGGIATVGQTALGSPGDGYLIKLNTSDGSRVWGTYVGYRNRQFHFPGNYFGRGYRCRGHY